MSVFLDKGHTKVARREWMDRAGGNGFRYQYEVVFADGAIAGPRNKVKSKWLPNEGTMLVVTPRDLYDSMVLEVGAVPTFPFAHWSVVQVFFRYRADDGSFEYQKDGVLKSGAASFITRFRVDKNVSGLREVRLSYRSVTGTRLDTPWMPMPQDQFVVEDPFGPEVQVRAIVSGERRNIANLLVDFEYEDSANDIFETGSMAFEPARSHRSDD